MHYKHTVTRRQSLSPLTEPQSLVAWTCFCAECCSSESQWNSHVKMRFYSFSSLSCSKVMTSAPSRFLLKMTDILLLIAALWPDVWNQCKESLLAVWECSPFAHSGWYPKRSIHSQQCVIQSQVVTAVNVAWNTKTPSTVYPLFMLY